MVHSRFNIFSGPNPPQDHDRSTPTCLLKKEDQSLTTSNSPQPPPLSPPSSAETTSSEMSLKSIKTQICLLLYIFTLAQSRVVHLHPSDKDALLHIYKGLALGHALDSDPCGSSEISCERRIVNGSYVTRVTGLSLESRSLKGQLSPSIGKLSELKLLSLRNNQLHGSIPREIVNCKKLEVLILGGNRFSGNISAGLLLPLTGLRDLDLSSNRFGGSLEFLKRFHYLEKLNLADNMFSGEVPLSYFKKLRSVNLSGNSLLEGDWPLVSDELDGKSISRRYVFTETSQGTNKSSSAIAPSSSLQSNAQAPSSTASPITKHKSTKKKIGQSILKFLAGILLGSVSGLVFVVLFKTIVYFIRRRKNETSLTIFSPMIKKPQDLAFLEKEDGLESFEIIGRGGCGTVYKVLLPGNNGMEFAIKKIVPSPSDGDDLVTIEESKLLNKKMRQIISEVQTVGQIRHRNLLPLLAHLPRPNCHFLVFEYMRNGSLQDYLQQVSEGRRELDWRTRYRIALGVATGLEYLHTNHNPCIIHRDLKPANVLLDEEMEAKITDFGLATAVPDSQTHITTSNIAGTVGYIAPEYYQTFQFTDKCDIFSFGVMLGVLVTGRFPSDEFFQHTEELSLVHWVRNLMTSEEPEKVIDTRLLGNGYEEQMLLVLKVACFCTLDNPKERPNSKDVRIMLSQINH